MDYSCLFCAERAYFRSGIAANLEGLQHPYELRTTAGGGTCGLATELGVGKSETDLLLYLRFPA